MFMTGRKTISTLLLATALGVSLNLGVGTPAKADDPGDDVYKFQTFTEMDVDKSGYVDEGEYKSYAFGRADWDNDGYLEKTEWASYTENYYDPYELEYESYTYYDTDGDGYIDRSEFNDYPTAGLFDEWDYDEDDQIGDADWDKVTAHYYDDE